jgi:hypothetical protein
MKYPPWWIMKRARLELVFCLVRIVFAAKICFSLYNKADVYSYFTPATVEWIYCGSRRNNRLHCPEEEREKNRRPRWIIKDRPISRLNETPSNKFVPHFILLPHRKEKLLSIPRRIGGSRPDLGRRKNFPPLEQRTNRNMLGVRSRQDDAN